MSKPAHGKSGAGSGGAIRRLTKARVAAPAASRSPEKTPRNAVGDAKVSDGWSTCANVAGANPTPSRMVPSSAAAAARSPGPLHSQPAKTPAPHVDERSASQAAWLPPGPVRARTEPPGASVACDVWKDVAGWPQLKLFTVSDESAPPAAVRLASRPSTASRRTRCAPVFVTATNERKTGDSG